MDGNGQCQFSCGDVLMAMHVSPQRYSHDKLKQLRAALEKSDSWPRNKHVAVSAVLGPSWNVQLLPTMPGLPTGSRTCQQHFGSDDAPCSCAPSTAEPAIEDCEQVPNRCTCDPHAV